MARLSLVVGDWQYSQLNKSQYKEQGFLFAKSPSKGEAPQYLDEHLIGVLTESLAIPNRLEQILTDLYTTEPQRELRKKSPPEFSHQDKAANHIKTHYDSSLGFLCFNQAGTGTGKTFANAKIMDAIQDGRLRYSLLLGLRSLTLQTGTEYRKKIGLNESDLAVVIGEKVTQELFEEDSKDLFNHESYEVEDPWTIADEVNLADDILSSVLKSKKARQILYSPVLVATIDHLIGSVEDTDRGRFLLPQLRVLSSDIVIDEVDDFDGNDMPAVLRLIHMAAMFGRNVIVSSATIPPEDAQAIFDAYLAGRSVYIKKISESKGLKEDVFCFWCDEYSVRSAVLKKHEQFMSQHEKFICKRITKIRNSIPKRKYYVIDNNKDNTLKKIKESIHYLHDKNCYIHLFGANISFGVIRLANISSVVNLSIGLLESKPEKDDMCFVVMPYHSRYPLIQRNEIEKELDANLKRNNKTTNLSETVKQIVKQKREQGFKDIVFVVVATPVEEVGRDHDFDWGILEVSSIRSLVQMIGRILRHRDIVPEFENVAILNRNIKTLNLDPGKNKPVFIKPGYENKNFLLEDKTFIGSIESDFDGFLDSIPRIKVRKDIEHNNKKNIDINSLAELEHSVLKEMLLEEAISKPYAWNCSDYHYFLGKFHQLKMPFRGDNNSIILYWTPSEVSANESELVEIYRKEKNITHNAKFVLFDVNNFKILSGNRLWLEEGYWSILGDKAEKKEIDIRYAALGKKYGQFSVPFYWLRTVQPVESKLLYNENMGFWKQDEKSLFLRNNNN
ncbi:MAG: hypothetical protein ACOC2E_06780 [Bacteroidota bacterium]